MKIQIKQKVYQCVKLHLEGTLFLDIPVVFAGVLGFSLKHSGIGITFCFAGTRLNGAAKQLDATNTIAKGGAPTRGNRPPLNSSFLFSSKRLSFWRSPGNWTWMERIKVCEMMLGIRVG